MTIEEANKYVQQLKPGDLIRYKDRDYVFKELKPLDKYNLAVYCETGWFVAKDVAPGNTYSITVTFLNQPIRKVTFQ